MIKLFLTLVLVVSISVLFSSEEAYADTVNLVPSSFGYVEVNAPSGSSSCGTTGAVKFFNSLLLRTATPGSPGDCRMSFVQWDTSSIPDGSEITKIVFNFEVTSVILESDECDMVDMGNTLTALSSAGSLAGPLQSNSAYVSAFGPCDDLGSQSVMLGSTANSDLESLLSEDRFFLGLRYKDNHERSGGSSTTTLSQASIDVTYTPNVIVAGEIIPIESTSLLLAGAQSTSWMIPVLVSAIGIGIFVVSRKSENS